MSVICVDDKLVRPEQESRRNAYVSWTPMRIMKNTPWIGELWTSHSDAGLQFEPTFVILGYIYPPNIVSLLRERSLHSVSLANVRCRCMSNEQAVRFLFSFFWFWMLLPLPATAVITSIHSWFTGNLEGKVGKEWGWSCSFTFLRSSAVGHYSEIRAHKFWTHTPAAGRCHSQYNNTSGPTTTTAL